MDAASHTGVDDVREIIENAQFKPVLARTKVFIIDEVHMLSKSAFNALLKTLEEPPEHVKFLFATTEIEKVPVTVRSRCQRFDLRRIEPDVLINHLAGICAKENVQIEREALVLIARAAEGSVRDSLSILDQAIAHGLSSGTEMIRADALREMLGVADRARVIDLFEAVMKGDAASALGILKDQYDMGADPAHVLTGLAEFIHFVTRLKLVPNDKPDSSVSPEEARRGAEYAAQLTMPVLTRSWQLLTKGLQDMKDAARPLAAADMVLVRLAYAADLPTPDDVIRRLSSASPADMRPAPRGGAPMGGGGGASASAAAVARPLASSPSPAPHQAPVAQARSDAAPRVQLARFEDVVTLAQVNRDIQLKIALERDVRLVRFEQGSLEFSLAPGASPQLAQTLMRRLQEWTGIRWMVVISREEGAPTIKEQADAKAEQQMTGVRALPLVRKVLEQFPGAEIVSIRMPEVETAPTTAAIAPETSDAGGDDIGYADQIYTEDDL
jgi:DNA polymerase-3 subunit gamma/tau